jgi:hypothetical protein
MRAPAMAALVSGIERVGGTAVAQRNGLVRINDEFVVALAVARYKRKSRYPSWELRYEPRHAPDIVVALRLDETNATVRDYYIVPRRVHQAAHTAIGPHNAERLDPYRFDDLSPLVAVSRRCALPDLAAKAASNPGAGPPEKRLLNLIETLCRLLTDKTLLDLLEAEGLRTIPVCLASQMPSAIADGSADTGTGVHDLELVAVEAYLRKLLGRAPILRFLAQYHRTALLAFESVETSKPSAT